MAARPIALDAPPRNARAELFARLQNAPQAHAEALLEACEVLQGLHDRGVLDFLRGLLGSSDAVLEVAVGAAKGPDSIRTIRNLLVLLNLLGAIDPEKLGAVARALPQVVEAVTQPPKPQGLWGMASGWLLNRDVRLALSAMQNAMQALGKSLRTSAK